jgi:hypothetical protein
MQEEKYKAQVLGKVAGALARLGDREGLKRALAATEAIQEEEYRAQVLGKVAWAIGKA